MKVVLIHNIPTPYVIPLFNAMAQSEEIQLRIIFLSEKDKNRLWEIYHNEIHFSYKILANARCFFWRFNAPIYLNWGLWSELKRFRPDAVCICGYHYVAAWETLLYGFYFKKKTILWAGSTMSSGSFHNSLTDYYKRLVIPRFDAYVTYGTAAQEQILHYGADSKKIIVGCNTVDIQFFASEAEKCRQQMDKGFSDRFPARKILYVGDLVPGKGVYVLIQAFEKISQIRNEDIGLILVGDGPERESLTTYVERRGLKNIFFEKYVQKKDIVKYYTAADVFVLPSFREVWGLVINEAMACGLPVVCSKYAGATRDLVFEGRNGFSFDPNEPGDLVTKILHILEDNTLRKKMAKESLKIISQRDITYYAKSILEAIMLSTKDSRF